MEYGLGMLREPINCCENIPKASKSSVTRWEAITKDSAL